MKFLKTILLLTMITATNPARANGPWEVFFQNGKFPSQALMEHQQWVTPLAGTTTTLKLSSALNSGSATTISSFSGQPDYPRNIVMSLAGSTGPTGTAVVSGLNIYGQVISENFAMVGNSTITGSKAFKSVSSVVYPATTGPGVLLNVGIGNKLGTLRCLNNAGDYVFSELDGAYDGTRGTMAVNASTIESNTFTPNGTMNGAKNVDLFYVQDFRCYQ